jgi:hypothetical protein
MTGTTLGVADPVQRSDHLLAQFRRLIERRRKDVRREIGETGDVGVAIDMKHVV